jgi:hypothetical protein
VNKLTVVHARCLSPQPVTVVEEPLRLSVEDVAVEKIHQLPDSVEAYHQGANIVVYRR